MKRFYSLLFLLVLHCKPNPPRNILSFVPAEPNSLIFAPKLSEVIENTNIYFTKLVPPSGSQLLATLKAGLQQYVGFDVLNLQDYRSLGLQVDAPVLFFTDATDIPVIVLTFHDKTKILKTIELGLQKLTGSITVKEQDKIVTGSNSLGEPLWHAAIVDHYVLITSGRGHLTSVLNAKTSSLDLTTLRSRLPQGQVFFYSKELLANIQIGATGLHLETLLDAHIPMKNTVLKTQAVHEDALVVFLTETANQQTYQAAQSVPLIKKLLALKPLPIQVDLEKELLPHLLGPLEIAVYLGSNLKDVNSFFNVSAVAQVKESPEFLTLLKRWQKTHPQEGFALIKNQFVYSRDKKRLPKIVALLKQPKTLKLPQQENAALVVLRSSVAAQALTELMRDKKLGTLNQFSDTLVQVFQKLNDVTLTVNAHDKGLRLHFDQSFL